MKVSTNILGFVILITFATSVADGQHTFTQTVTAENKSCNNHCTVIDVPELNNNPNALIFVTQATGNGTSPIGAYYMYQKKWSIYNLNGAVMPVKATFDVEYYTGLGSDRFVYVVPQRTNPSDDAYIDFPGLNGNPNAKVRIFPTNPKAGDANFSQNRVHTAYVASASKWAIIDDAFTAVPSGLAYNILFTGGVFSVLPPNQTGTLLSPPSSAAGGDLNGNYPNPRVIGLQGKPISATPPAVGQVLRWNGTEWAPVSDPVSTGGPASGDLSGNYPAPSVQKLNGRPLSNAAPAVGYVLKWNGTAWEPAADNVGTASQGTSAAKPSVLFFNSHNPPFGIDMKDPNVNTVKIGGLDNQFFTLAQQSRVVFYTTVAAQNNNLNFFRDKVDITLTVDILNSSGVLVGRSTAGTVLETGFPVQTMVGVGMGILPAGTYHTSVTITRGVYGSALSIYDYGYDAKGAQGSQMILEIFPD